MLRQGGSGSAGHGRAHMSSSTSTTTVIRDTVSMPAADPDYIMQLVNDVRALADLLLSLKESLNVKEPQESSFHLVQERLSELLRVLKSVISRHHTLNSVDILSAAGTLIARVKGLNFKEVSSERRSSVFCDIHSSIDTLAFTVGNVVSDFLMGDVDSSSRVALPQARRSRSFENLSGDSGGSAAGRDALTAGPAVQLSPVERVDQALLQNDSGVESALLYAKVWSKYVKDLLSWVEKRLNLSVECAKSFAKMAESAKTITSQQDYMPFTSIYVSAFEHEIENNQVLLQTAAALQTNRFIQPLVARKNELDKLRKELKEQWQREQKRMSEADGAVHKAQQVQVQRREEYEKARGAVSRSADDQSSAMGKSLERKRRIEEEALQRAEEAQVQYKACVADAEQKRVALANAKNDMLTRIRELVFQCDLTLKAVTVNWFQMCQSQVAALPQHYQALCEQAKQYEPGQCYSEFVHSLPKERVWLEALSQDSTGPSRTGKTFHKRSVSSPHSSHGSLSPGPAPMGDAHSAAVRTQCPQQAWSPGSQGGGGMCSDSESAGGSSESRSVDSPTASPGDFKRRLPRTPSTGTMSSADDLDEREPPSPLDNGLGDLLSEATNSPGPFRNALMSKAAHTHKLRKLRAPSKCRECDSLVVFHGAECEECSLACHKRCLETLAIQCGHKKLQGRLHLFGIDFSQAAKNSPDGIPFIIKKCTSEIESRALSIKGIYRVNGAKSRVEKLCQAFENGKDLVELSDLQPHDISNVLKLYLRQLPEPLIQYRLYNKLIGLAKEAQNAPVDEVESGGEQPCVSSQLKRIVLQIRDQLRQLPPAHLNTLHYLISHLNRVVERAEENKMTASNLGIIFGPTLLKPRQVEAEVSLSSLVDYPYQALLVELLITHQQLVFHPPLTTAPAPTPTHSPAPQHHHHKERLSRHSRSLLDIKEPSSRSYKRHSSVISSSHLLDEVKEGKAGEGKQVREDTADADSIDVVNGVGSGAELHKSAQVSIRPGTTSRPVQLRQHRVRPASSSSRPVSMPVDRLLSDRSASDHSPGFVPAPIREVSEVERGEWAEPRYRSPFFEMQTLRRTWDKQYRHYDVTPRTAMIVANLPQTDRTKPAPGPEPPAAAPAPTPSPTPVPTLQSTQLTLTLKPFRPSRRDSAQGSEAPIAFRAPRTLQPPPGTFYRPPSMGGAGGGVKSLDPERAVAATVTAVTKTQTSVTGSVSGAIAVTTVTVTMAAPVATATLSTTSINASEEELGTGQQRTGSGGRRAQSLEHRETHFV